MSLRVEPPPSSPPSPPPPAYAAPPTYSAVTVPAFCSRTESKIASSSSLPSKLLLLSGSIRADGPISRLAQSSKDNPIYCVRHVGPTLLYLLDASRTEQVKRGHDAYADVAYKIHRHDVGKYLLLPGPRGEDAGNGISLRASVSPKGMCYTVCAVPEPDKGEKRRPEKSDRPHRDDEGPLLFRSDGTQPGGRRWVYCAMRSGKKITVAVEKEPKPDSLLGNASTSKFGESGPRWLEFSEAGMGLGDGVRELLVACWVARVWRWGDVKNEKGNIFKWARGVKEIFTGERAQGSS